MTRLPLLQAVDLMVRLPDLRGGHPHGGQPLYSVVRLFGGFRHGNVDRDIFAAKLTIVESHAAFSDGEQRVIAADANILACIHFGSALANQDVSCFDKTTVAGFDAQILWV